MGHYTVNRVLFDLNRRPDKMEILKNLEAFLAGYTLDEKEKRALLDRDFAGLLALGVLPNLVFKLYLWSGFPPAEYAARVGGTRE
jgi:hypothetical protein